MINYILERQLKIEEFKTPFETALLLNNRWGNFGQTNIRKEANEFNKSL